ncbi:MULTISPECIES: hypothetical protein [unclassified Methanosarcina]|uniref:hypothetical protein n=1 Tax=unclassified Methanosarcina TaxID=2644672 RepID=UPI000615E4A5|nr:MULTISPECIES: hypothetical protein [unclassified Methanosarcina]AKB19024.1 hypothetical protein MSWHS_2161 [Methanosarcina sp. WWM596]AKB23112.1 hypothetical protein MSWH1_2841 [Methanosarcina sp. WH1]
MMTEFKSETPTLEIPRGYGMSVIKLYFWVGLISAILLRGIIIVDHYSVFWGKAIWYLGVAGYLWFFTHRYHIAKRRCSVVQDLDLLEKVRTRQKLSEKDLEGMEYLLWSLSVSKERANYLVISVFSIIALALSLGLDLGILKL